MKKRIGLAILSLLLAIAPAFGLIHPVAADSVDLYWYPVAGSGTGNWSTGAGGHWATDVSGGGLGHAMPTSTNTVHFGSYSFTGAGQTVSIDQNPDTCLSMDWTGVTNSPTLQVNSSSSLSVYGSITFVSGMTITGGTGSLMLIRFEGPGDRTLTNGGVTIGCKFGATPTFSGKVTLQDALVSNNGATSAVQWQSGTLDSNNKSITVSTNFSDGGSTAAKTLTLGSSVISCANFDFPSAGLTLTANTATMNLSSASITLGASYSFSTLGFTRAGIQTITATGTVQTFTNLVRDAGTAVKTLAGGTYTKAGGGYSEIEYASISGSTATPANSLYAGTHSTDGGGNSGWVFNDAAAPAVTTQAGSTTMNGTVTDTGGAQSVSTFFQYGTTTGYGSLTSGVAHGLGAYTATIPTSLAVGTYHYRAGATNGVGTTYGADQTFTVATNVNNATHMPVWAKDIASLLLAVCVIVVGVVAITNGTPFIPTVVAMVVVLIGLVIVMAF